jgi:hypothetical protein
MSQTWGRTGAAGTWPHLKPVWTLATLLVGLLGAGAIGAYRYVVIWTPLQRVYLSPYLQSQARAGLGFTTPSRYRLLEVTTRAGRRLALDDEVRIVATPTGAPTFALTEVAMKMGDRQLIWQDASSTDARLHAFLGRWIYHDQTVADLVRPAVWGGCAVGLVGLLVAIPMDVARARDRRHGRRLKGPELVTAAQFNLRTGADGIGFVQQPRLFRRPSVVRVPRALESSHFLIMGDSGTGKSSLIRQVLGQLQDRGETAIVYDPAIEYTPEFYCPERGDLILNPLDARSPSWSPSEEWRHEAEALTLATSLFPDRRERDSFFTNAPRRIFAHLLTLNPRPTPEQLAWWLCHEDEIDRRLVGTPYAVMIARQSPDQRSGVLGSLNMVADALKLLPPARETTRHWSAVEWSTARRGWLFLTSTPATRPQLLPLTSLWLDLLVLRLMEEGPPGLRRTWFVLDELQTLEWVPQLHTAITENRKANTPLVLGFQARSQLETRYGHDADAMLSQPATKMLLRTSEPRAARWVSETLGEIEIDRLRESRSTGRGGQQTYGLERQVEPLVMASEITGLANLRGYLKMGNLVVRLRVPYVDLPKRVPKFVERARTPIRQDDPTASTAEPVTAPLASDSPAPALAHTGEAQRLEPERVSFVE